MKNISYHLIGLIRFYKNLRNESFASNHLTASYPEAAAPWN